MVFPQEIDAGLVGKVSRWSSGGSTVLQTELQTQPGSIKKNNVVVIKDPFDMEQWAGRRSIFRFEFVRAPPSDAETSPFQFMISERDEATTYGIEENTKGVTIKVQATQLTAFEFTSLNRAVFSPLDAVLSVRFKGLVQTTSVLYVVYPSELKKNTAGGSTASVSLDDGSPVGTHQVIESNQTIIIRNFAITDFDFSASPSGRSIKIFLKEVLMNPVSEKPVQGFSIYLKDGRLNNVASYDYKLDDPTNPQNTYVAQ